MHCWKFSNLRIGLFGTLQSSIFLFLLHSILIKSLPHLQIPPLINILSLTLNKPILSYQWLNLNLIYTLVVVGRQQNLIIMQDINLLILIVKSILNFHLHKPLGLHNIILVYDFFLFEIQNVVVAPEFNIDHCGRVVEVYIVFGEGMVE